VRAQRAEGTSKPIASETLSTNGKHRVRVVVVDDHELFRGGLVTLLAERGIEVVAQTGMAAEAIELVSRHRPDVVLMDLSMPGMTRI
jgi:DNA-binding NarL/FixJ family response regulator